MKLISLNLVYLFACPICLHTILCLWHYFSRSLFQQRRWWRCLCSRSPLYCHLCRTMVSLMSCYMHCSSKMWVCHNNIYFPFFIFFKTLFSLMPTHSVHSKLLLPPHIPSIFLHCCTSLPIPAAHYTRFRPFICFYRSLPPEKCWVPCLTSSAPCAWMPVVCTHLCSASPSSGCSRCCSHQTTCLPCAADAALTP